MSSLLRKKIFLGYIGIGKSEIPSFFRKRQGGQHILSGDTQPRGPPNYG